MTKLAFDLDINGDRITDPVGSRYADIGDIFSGSGGQPGILAYALGLAGILILIFFIWGGFEVLASTGDPQKIKRGTERILHAVVGFLILFATYWIVKLVEVILGVEILG